MLKRVFCLLMAFSVTVSSAMASTSGGLKSAFDELNYAINVEWDQKDKTFYKNEMKKFRTAISNLKNQGLTEREMLEMVKSEVKDERVARDIETAFSIISINQMNPSDATNYMLETMKKAYSSGASWNGEMTYILYSSVILIAFIAVFVSADSDSASTGTTDGSGGYYCYQHYTCDSYCYNDYYLGYTCDQNCYWTCW